MIEYLPEYAPVFFKREEFQTTPKNTFNKPKRNKLSTIFTNSIDARYLFADY